MEQQLQYLKGVGPSRAESFKESGIQTIMDLLFYFPISYIDREAMLTINEAYKNIYRRQFYSSLDLNLDADFIHEIVIVGKIVEKEFRRGRKNFSFLSLTIKDDSGTAKINFWSMAHIFDKLYEKGITVAVYGKPTIDKYGNLAFDHPEIDIIVDEDEKSYSKGGIIPKYRINDKMKKGHISQKTLRKVIETALNENKNFIDETLPLQILEKYSFPEISTTIRTLHFPSARDKLAMARRRIKFEELFYYFIRLALRKRSFQCPGTGIIINPKSTSARKLYDKLPFNLTNDQKKALNDIAADFQSAVPMHRLLQGDVGSGKTIVALLSMLMVTDQGYQSVLIAPTEILAEQHYKTITKLMSLAELDNINVICITGGALTKSKKNDLSEIASGEQQIIIGTHALFQDKLEYNKLAYVVIDEQQRFGVLQKSRLVELAENSFQGVLSKIKPHILVTTATPIPRSIMMTVSGDLDVSTIKTKPRNRKPIITKIVFESEREEVYKFIRKNIADGRQVYIVYPLVEESKKIDSKSAVQMYEHFQNDIFPDIKCGLLHGQMNSQEKDAIMESFLNKDFDILVATTVIEVGIDVPNANLIIIENTERFGLSQLHQLRGRVGRDEYQSYCILLANEKYKHLVNKSSKENLEGQAAIVRLKAMEETNDGFKISEIDLKLRGPGDIIGTKQSGALDFKYANIIDDSDIMAEAREMANNIVKNDPDFQNYDNKIIKQILIKNFGANLTYDVA